MNALLRLLEGGDLRSDGRADEVAGEIIENPKLFDLLWDGIYDSDDIVRARTAHALEKVSRELPELFDGLLDEIIDIGLKDSLPMIKWHFAMLLVNLNLSANDTIKVLNLLVKFLEDKSIFVKTWSISSFTIIALQSSEHKDLIISKISSLKDDKSRAVRNRVNKSLNILEKGMELPKG